ncbi:mechanosensitive ion channel [Candidatus Halobeggiatoa sp. HSG11]|nr:mechanosensitive ion channel [Candidatus Halobeggiatoa sp. HSG11]
MSLLKKIPYLILIIVSIVNAEPTSEIVTSEEIVTVTKEWVETQENVISKISSSLKNVSNTLKKQQKDFKKKTLKLKKVDKITDKMLEEAAEQKQLIKAKLENLKVKRQQLRDNLDQHISHVAKLPIKAQKEITLYKQAIKLEKSHIELLNKKAKLFIKQINIAMQWHSKLQTKRIQTIIKEHKQIIELTQTELKHIQEKFILETDEHHKSLENLESLENITDTMMDESAQSKQDINNKLEKLRVERQTAQGFLENYSTRLMELQTALEKLPQSKELKIIQKQTATEIEQYTILYQQLASLEKVHLEQLNTKNITIIKQTLLALEWHSQLKHARIKRFINKQEQTINTSKINLVKNKESLDLEQKDLPNKIITLKTAESTVEALKIKFEKAVLDNHAAEVEAKNLDLEYQSTDSDLKHLNSDFEQLQIKLETMRKTPPVEEEQLPIHEKRIAILENKIKLKEQILNLKQQQLDIIKQQFEQANKRVTLNVEWYDKIRTVYLAQQEQELEKHIRQEQRHYFKQADDLRQKLDLIPDLEQNSIQRYLLEVKIQVANELAQRAMRQLKVRHVNEQLEQWYKTVDAQKELKEVLQGHVDGINVILKELTKLLQEIKSLEISLQDKTKILKQQLNMAVEQSKTLTEKNLQYNTTTQQELTTLHSSLRQELSKLPSLLKQGNKLLTLLEEVYKDNVHQALVRQRILPATIDGWQNMLTEITTIPKVFFEQLKFIQDSFFQSLQQTTNKNWIIFGTIMLIWTMLIIWFRFWSNKVLKDAPSNKKYLLRLWHKNSVTIIFASGFLLFMWITKPNQASVLFSLILIGVFLASKLLLNFAWLILSQLQESNKFYPQVRRIVIIISILIIITAQIHLLSEGQVSLGVRDLIDSVFMILLSLAIPILFSIRKFIIAPLEVYVQGYLLNITKLLLLTLPIIILTISILGIVGYITLGWIIIKYLSMLLSVLLGWMIIQLFTDILIGIWKNIALKQGVYGSLWAEDLIPLIHSILRLALFGVAIVSLLWLTGWYSDVAIREGIDNVLHYPLATFNNGNHITVISIFTSILMIWIVFWFGSWTRRITYRWIFSNITDSGIRHSLSIFTQYTIIVLGLTTTLKVIGVDPTALSVFAGALGVGIGFGMRSLVANFISGVLLLIERPLRVGDLIDIGGNSKGVVKRIGIRSTVIETEDKKIAVPNSRVIDRPFTNLGKDEDNEDENEKIIIEVSCENDPHLVKKLLTNTMKKIPAILEEPKSNVLLAEFIHNKMSFSISYKVTNLAEPEEVKSQLLFDIWDQFKANKIKISQTISESLSSNGNSNYGKGNDDDFIQLFLK